MCASATTVALPRNVHVFNSQCTKIEIIYACDINFSSNFEKYITTQYNRPYFIRTDKLLIYIYKLTGRISEPKPKV